MEFGFENVAHFHLADRAKCKLISVTIWPAKRRRCGKIRSISGTQSGTPANDLEVYYLASLSEGRADKRMDWVPAATLWKCKSWMQAICFLNYIAGDGWIPMGVPLSRRKATLLSLLLRGCCFPDLFINIAWRDIRDVALSRKSSSS